MGSYPTKEQAEHAVYEQMRVAATALLQRWTRDLLANGVITYGVADDEVEGWLIEQCSRPSRECDPSDLSLFLETRRFPDDASPPAAD